MQSSVTPSFPSDDLAQEEVAACSFIKNFINSGHSTLINLEVCTLQDALYSLYLNTNKHKILILYLHNEGSTFSKDFCSFLSSQNVEHILDTHYIVLGWNIEDAYQEILINALSNVLKLSHCTEMVRQKQAAAVFITTVDMDFEICSVMKFTERLDDFKTTLENLVDCFCRNSVEEVDLSQNNAEDEDNFSYEEFQQRMCDSLGDRDYDSYGADELQYLKQKIAYALCGVPVEETGYDDKQKEDTDKMYEVILESNNEFSEYENQVVMAVVYTCLIPLESEEVKDKFVAVPVFILRKCREADVPCRIVIDHTKRVYESWNDYLEDNKFYKCLMVVPEDGCYTVDENGNVKLKKVYSPACNVGQKVLKATDISTTVLGLGSSAVMVGAAIPAITIAPIALIGAGCVGAAVGVYSIGRSICTLVDRGSHKQSINVTDSEARGAYFNIAAGAAGFAGAGANALVSNLASNGVTIGRTARIAVNTLSVTNIGIGGLAVGNSAVDVFMQWWVDDEPPSTLTLLQLSTSILFFSHAVYNFKTAGTIIEETQASSLKEYNDSLRSNRHRKMFKKLELETVRQNNGNVQQGRAEVIRTMRNINNKDDVFAFLTRNNKKLNEMGIRFCANEGQVTFNGVQMDLVGMSSMPRSKAFSFFSDLSNCPNGSNYSGQLGVKSDLNASLYVNISDMAFKFVVNMVQPTPLRKKVLSICEQIFIYFENEMLAINARLVEFIRDLFPDATVRYLEYAKMLLLFLHSEFKNLESALRNDQDHPLSFIFKYVKDLNVDEKKLVFLYIVCDNLILAFQSPIKCLQNLVIYFTEWILSVYMENQQGNEHILTNGGRQKNTRVTCKKCSGHYFK